MEPVTARDVPDGQLTQLDAPVLAWYRPAWQLLQALAPPLEIEPAAQFAQFADPELAWKVPRAQFVHCAARGPEYVPGAQIKQLPAPSTLN